MSPEHLRSLLTGAAAADPSRSVACPDEQEIAGYVDGGLDEVTRKKFELHLAYCTRCLELVGLLCRERDADAIEPVTHEVVTRAHTVVTKGPQRRWRPVPQWAAAAALVWVMLMSGGRLPQEFIYFQF